MAAGGRLGPAADKRHRFGTTDLVIDGLAREVAALLWSLDADFRRTEELGLVHL